MKRIAIGYCIGAALTLAWQVSASNMVGACDFNQAACKTEAIAQARNALFWPVYLANLGN